jgi:alpha-amylase
MLADLARQWEGRFRVSLSITGTLLEQLEQNAPDVIQLLQELVGTGCCEILGETYNHSLSALYWPEEFAAQVDLHAQKVGALLGVTPTAFRNTELIYSNDVARLVGAMRKSDGSARYVGMLAEGSPQILGSTGSAEHVYAASGVPNFGVLLRNSTLSDDIAFRFSLRSWPHWPLTAEKYAHWLFNGASGSGSANVFIDFETFGEHQWAENGIFQFFRALPGEVFKLDPRAKFLSISQAIAAQQPHAIIDCPNPTSWADASRDISAWRGNAMQMHAGEELYRFGRHLQAQLAGLPPESMEAESLRDLQRTWRRLTTSDHVYYMSTKGAADGQVHSYFRPFDSPYDAYISFVNVLANMRKAK